MVMAFKGVVGPPTFHVASSAGFHVALHFKVQKGRAVIANPSVVNGAQTLYAVSGSSHGASPALVTVRVITRAEHELDEHVDGIVVFLSRRAIRGHARDASRRTLGTTFWRLDEK